MMELVGSQTFAFRASETHNQMTDYELISICLSGRNEAFSGIIARYKKLVHATIYNLIGDSHDINDLFQEVFLRAYRSLKTYNPDYHFSTWITKITVNICLDRIRKKSQEQGAAEDIEEIADERMNPEERCIMEEQRRRIRKAVAALPEQYRVPLVLFHQEGFSYEAMVDIIGEPLSIIKNRLYRARLMLRSALKPEKETIP